MKKPKIKTIKGAVILMTACVIVLGMINVSAYVMSRDRALNNVTVGNVEIDTTEPGFDTEAAKNLEPGQTIEKDPTVKNTGDNPCYVFATVDVPIENVKTYDSENIDTVTEDETELFELIPTSDEDYAAYPATWSLIDETKISEEYGTSYDGKTYERYVYGYVDSAGDCAKVVPAGQEDSSKGLFSDTPPIFSHVKYANVIEGQLEDSFNINVTTYAIQANDVTIADTTDPETLWNIICEQEEVY